MSKKQVKRIETEEPVKEDKMGGDLKGLDALFYHLNSKKYYRKT